MPSNIGKALYEKGVKQKTVAEKLGVSPGVVCGWCADIDSTTHRWPDVHNFLDLAELIGHDVKPLRQLLK